MGWVQDLIGWKPTDNGNPPEAPTIATAPSIETASLNNQYDLIMAALCIWREARGEPREGKVAVFWVIKNRVAAGWGPTVLDVILAPKQFSCFNADDQQVALYPKHADKDWVECLGVVTGNDPNPIGPAKNYFNDAIADPAWAKSMIEQARIGRHVFYRDPI
jgi:N-acetylmuramoyl-L-alanine amidase